MISRLEYTKRWTNPTDFPTYEASEVQVREDMQYLFDEIAEYLNTILGAVEGGSAGTRVVQSDNIASIRIGEKEHFQYSADGVHWSDVFGSAFYATYGETASAELEARFEADRVLFCAIPAPEGGSTLFLPYIGVSNDGETKSFYFAATVGGTKTEATLTADEWTRADTTAPHIQAEESAALAGEYSTAAGKSAGAAREQAAAAAESAEEAEGSAVLAAESAEEAEGSAVLAAESEGNASGYAAAAGASAAAAQAAALSMSFVTFTMSKDGHLIIKNSERLGTTSFKLNENGHLEVTI